MSRRLRLAFQNEGSTLHDLQKVDGMVAMPLMHFLERNNVIFRLDVGLDVERFGVLA